MFTPYKPKREWVPIERLIRDKRLQMRTGLLDGLTDPATVERYKELIEEGVEFPPLESVSDGNSYWLFDGFQRAAALERAGKGSAECFVSLGSYSDALLLAFAANSRHGLTRTPSDCRRALTTLLDSPEILEAVLLVSRERGGVYRTLAATCGISKGLVYKVLEERNLHVVGGKLIKKHVMAAANQITSRPVAEQTAYSDDRGNENSRESISESEQEANVSCEPLSLPDASRELDRARAAVASLWSACRELLDGPLGVKLLRLAAHHRIPFSREGSPECLIAGNSTLAALSSVAWWEPLGKIEAVLADLSASLCAGADDE